jgi:hypothetical protein
MPKKLYLVGTTFGRLKVMDDGPLQIRPNGQRIRSSLCLCSCGNYCTVLNGHLRSGHSRSCGCLAVETTRIRATIHGHARKGQISKTFISWEHLINRCTNTNDAAWKNYGGRGISVCDRWLRFENFLADMGEKPEGKMIERKNNNGNYEPSNCCWATSFEQNRNKRNNRNYTVKGVTACFDVICHLLSISRSTVNYRLRTGWPIEKAFCHTPRPSGRRANVS